MNADFVNGTTATFKLPIGDAIDLLLSDEGYYLI